MDIRIYDPQTKEFLNLSLGRVLSVGRSIEADIRIPNLKSLESRDLRIVPYISGIHASIIFDGKSLGVLDTSRNGTYVRDSLIRGESWVRLEPNRWTHLKRGYEIGFGRASEERKYVLQLTDEESIRRSLQEENARRFVEIIRRERTEL